MSLPYLPTLVTAGIVQALTCQEFENLALSCHWAYELLTPFLARHNAYRRTFEKVVFPVPLARYQRWSDQICGIGNPSQLDTVPSLLQKIAQDPFIASCIKHLDLSRRSVDQQSDYATRLPEQQCPTCRDGTCNNYQAHEPTIENGIMTPASHDLVRSLVEHSTHLKLLPSESSQPGQWLCHLVHETEPNEFHADYVAVFLLSLLPNLESLVLPSCWETITVTGPSAASELLHLLICRANDSSLLGPQPLRKLTHLSADVADNGYHEEVGIPLTTILPFLSLTSLLSAYHSLGTLEYVQMHPGLELSAETQAWLRYRPVGPNIETLSLVNAGVSGDDNAKVLFRDMVRLRTLKLAYSMRDQTCTDYEPQTLMNVVMEAAGGTLEVLCLTMAWEFPVYEVGPPLRNLRGLTGLREFEVDTALFYKWTCGENEDEDDLEGQETTEDEDSDGENKDDVDGKGDDSGEDNADENDAKASVSYDSDSDEGEDESPNGCPSITKLLQYSLQTLEKVTIHMPAQRADFICLKRLLCDFPSNSSRGSDDGIDVDADGTSLPMLRLKVCLYHQDHWEDEIAGAPHIIEQARVHLKESVPGCDIEVVPYTMGLERWPSHEER